MLWRLLRVAVLTFCLDWFEGRVNACICRRSALGMVHHGGQRVEFLGPVASAGMGAVGLAVYMTQNGGRGVAAPISTLSVCSGGNVSKSVIASLVCGVCEAVAPDMCVCLDLSQGCGVAFFATRLE